MRRQHLVHGRQTLQVVGRERRRAVARDRRVEVADQLGDARVVATGDQPPADARDRARRHLPPFDDRIEHLLDGAGPRIGGTRHTRVDEVGGQCAAPPGDRESGGHRSRAQAHREGAEYVARPQERVELGRLSDDRCDVDRRPIAVHLLER